MSIVTRHCSEYRSIRSRIVALNSNAAPQLPQPRSAACCQPLTLLLRCYCSLLLRLRRCCLFGRRRCHHPSQFTATVPPSSLSSRSTVPHIDRSVTVGWRHSLACLTGHAAGPPVRLTSPVQSAGRMNERYPKCDSSSETL